MGEKGPGARFHQILQTFPRSVEQDLSTLQANGGMLSAERCRLLMNALNISAEDLMQRLLPVAKLYSATPISDFQIGAVAKARMPEDESGFALFLGANIEFSAQALIQTIHAEQSAVINAWLRDAKRIDSIAVTAAPCGHCRQFLNELDGSRNLKVIMPDRTSGQTLQHDLPDFLPQAFGPRDLGSAAGLMTSSGQPPALHLKSSSKDPFVLEALAAAEKSHAPYSNNLAGCVIETASGKTHAGRYAENAAFNPSLSALHTAIIRMSMDPPGMQESIRRAILVEKRTATSQRTICELLLQTVAQSVTLEYHEATDG